MSTLKQDYSKVAGYCSEMKVISNNMQKNLDNIKKDMQLSSTSWTGTVANSFFQKTNELSKKFADFSEELNACILYMKKCSLNYEKLDSNIKKNIDSQLSKSKYFNK